MKMKPSVIALGLCSSLTLYGCGSDDNVTDSGSTDNPDSSSSDTTYSVKAIDGYLRGATVWLDLNDNSQLDSGEPSATSEDGGVATLDVTGIDNPETYPVVVQAIQDVTVDESTGNTVSRGFTMSAPPGVAQITPLSTLVHIEVKSGGSADVASATAKIATQMGINEEDVLSDYGTSQGSKKAAFAARNIVSSNSLPVLPSDLNDAASDNDGSNALLEAAAVIAVLIKDQVDNKTEEELDDVFINSQGTVDSDTDGDGVPDQDDAFADNAAEWLDTDGDKTGNNEDTDDDGDGVLDVDDAFPLDPDESKDTDDDGIGDNSDPDIDGDGYLNENDDFDDDPNEWLDTDLDGTGNNADTDDDGDGYADSEDSFPLDENEWLDTDGDTIGNNADSDDDGDGVPDNIDEDPLDKNVGATPTGAVILYLETQSVMYGVDVDDDDEIRRVYTEQLDISGTKAQLTTRSLIKANKSAVTVSSDDMDLILTADGWAQDSDQYTVDFSDNSLIAYPTNYPEISYTLSGSLVDLADDVIADSDFDWDNYTDETATFPANAYLLKLGLTPMQNTYYMWDWSPYLHDNLNDNSHDGVTSLAELIFDTLGSSSVSTGELQGMSIGEDIIVKFVTVDNSNTAQYYTIDWDAGQAELVATGSWSQQTINTETLLLFSLPSDALTAFGDAFDEPTPDMFVSVYNGMVYIGNQETADVLLENENLVLLNETAKNALIDNLELPVIQCSSGDTDGTTTVGMTEFATAIDDCYGASVITDDMVIGNNFHRVRGDGTTRDYTFNADGTLTVYKDSVEAYTANWAIADGYITITYEDSPQESWIWALLDYNTTTWSLKFLDTYLDGSDLITEIWSDTVSLVDVGSCVIEEGLDKSYSDFTSSLQAYADCNGGLPTVAESDVYGAELFRVKSNGETRLYTFESDGSATYYKDGMARSRTWSVNDDGLIEIRYSESGIDQYLALLADPVDDVLKFAVFAPEDTEIWLTQYTDISDDAAIEECTIGNSDYDENGDPVTTFTYAEYTQSADDCILATESSAAFSADFMAQLPRSMTTTFEGEIESYTFNQDGSTGTYSEGSNSFDFTWSVDDTSGELIITVTVGDQTYLDNIRIVDTDGVEFSLKVLSRSTELDGLEETSAGDVWSGIYTFE